MGRESSWWKSRRWNEHADTRIFVPEARQRVKEGLEALRVGLGSCVMGFSWIVNRGSRESVPEAVWDKVSADGTVFGVIGPANLMQSLAPVWPAERP